MSFHEKEYIGDSVYVIRDDAGDLVLTLGDGISEKHRIVMEPIVYRHLVEYADRTWEERQTELKRLEETG